MKTKKNFSAIIIAAFLVSKFFIFIPKISVASYLGPPDQFISELFPNSTIPLQLPYTNTIITFNATDFPNKIDFVFDANYTIYNPENSTTIPVILPFSFTTNISDFIFEVYVNNTLINHDILSVSPWNDNLTEINIRLAWFIELHPIILLKSNITLGTNSTSVIRYHISGSMSNPVAKNNIFFLAYHIGTSQNWIGNTTGKVEIRAYGKQPIFGVGGFSYVPPQVEDILGGKSYICEWNNIISPNMDVRVRYHREQTLFEKIIEFIKESLWIFIILTIVIIGVVILKKRKPKTIYD